MSSSNSNSGGSSTSWSALASAGGELVSGLVSAGINNYWNKKGYELAKDELYNGYSIAASDMANAGLNPILSSGAGASTSSFSANKQDNPASGLGNLAASYAQMKTERSIAEQNRQSQEKIVDAQLQTQSAIAQSNNLLRQQEINNQRSKDLMDAHAEIQRLRQSGDLTAAQVKELEKRLDVMSAQQSNYEAMTSQAQQDISFKNSADIFFKNNFGVPYLAVPGVRRSSSWSAAGGIFGIGGKASGSESYIPDFREKSSSVPQSVPESRKNPEPEDRDVKSVYDSLSPSDKSAFNSWRIQYLQQVPDAKDLSNDVLFNLWYNNSPQSPKNRKK